MLSRSGAGLPARPLEAGRGGGEGSAGSSVDQAEAGAAGQATCRNVGVKNPMRPPLLAMVLAAVLILGCWALASHLQGL